MLLMVYTGCLQYYELKIKQPLQINTIYNILRQNYDMLMNKITKDGNRYLPNESNMLSAVRTAQMKVDFAEDQMITLGHIFMPSTSITILDQDSITNVTCSNGTETKILLISISSFFCFRKHYCDYNFKPSWKLWC